MGSRCPRFAEPALLRLTGLQSRPLLGAQRIHQLLLAALAPGRSPALDPALEQDPAKRPDPDHRIQADRLLLDQDRDVEAVYVAGQSQDGVSDDQRADKARHEGDAK